MPSQSYILLGEGDVRKEVDNKWKSIYSVLDDDKKG